MAFAVRARGRAWGLNSFIFRQLIVLKENYWFWPSAMTIAALVAGFALPSVDAWLGSDWITTLGIIRPIGATGARDILTTLASATLGVAGVAFSVTIVAVSFASANYGPRLIGNFMGDRTNQIVLGIFVATFVYCIAVLSTVHAAEESREAFVPQISLVLALLMTLAAVGALIVYIHHIPESINIMNLTATIGDKLQRLVVRMLEEQDRGEGEGREPVNPEPWPTEPLDDGDTILRAGASGFLQQVDFEGLTDCALKQRIQIMLHRAPGDFLVTGDVVMSLRGTTELDPRIARRLQASYTLGANRTDRQDVLFLADQLVEVLGRALSSGVNDPDTAMLCLNWLKAGLGEFARRPPAQPAQRDDPVLYRRVTFEDMLERSFDGMRQHVAADRNVTLHAFRVLGHLARIAVREPMAEACTVQMRRLAASARALQSDSTARADIDAGLRMALGAAARRD